MLAEVYLLPLPTADPGTWAPMSPAQVNPWVRIVDSVEITPEIGAREEPRRSGAW